MAHLLRFKYQFHSFLNNRLVLTRANQDSSKQELRFRYKIQRIGFQRLKDLIPSPSKS